VLYHVYWTWPRQCKVVEIRYTLHHIKYRDYTYWGPCVYSNWTNIYSGASLIRTPLIRMLHYPDDISGEQTIWRSIKCDSFIRTLHLFGRFCWEPKCPD
jgi:hypothetical protein